MSINDQSNCIASTTKVQQASQTFTLSDNYQYLLKIEKDTGKNTCNGVTTPSSETVEITFIVPFRKEKTVKIQYQ